MLEPSEDEIQDVLALCIDGGASCLDVVAGLEVSTSKLRSTWRLGLLRVHAMDATTYHVQWVPFLVTGSSTGILDHCCRQETRSRPRISRNGARRLLHSHTPYKTKPRGVILISS